MTNKVFGGGGVSSKGHGEYRSDRIQHTVVGITSLRGHKVHSYETLVYTLFERLETWRLRLY